MKRVLFAVGACIAVAGTASADKPMKDKSAKTMKGSQPMKMTCEDFIALDDTARPKVVYWAEGYNKKGKPEDAVIDVETVDRVVPVLVEDCKQQPKESFWKKAKEEFKKVF